MFETNCAIPEKWQSESPVHSSGSLIDSSNIDYMSHLVWKEECIEFVTPSCYKTCALFELRRDGACARFYYGIILNTEANGIYGYGGDLKFKKWGKIEADLNKVVVSPLVSLAGISPLSIIPDQLNHYITQRITKKHLQAQVFDHFLFECYSPYEGNFKLIMEYHVDTEFGPQTRFRGFLQISNGYNVHQVPFHVFNMDKLEGHLYLYPESNKPEKRLVITCLDFVKYRLASHDISSKIKCLVWSVDMLLPQNDDPEAMIDPAVIALVKVLDQRGVIQSITGRFDPDEAFVLLKKAGLDAYFLFPAINTESMGSNLAAIANKLEVDFGSIGVISGSGLELDDPESPLNQISVYSGHEIPFLLSYDEFNLPVSSQSINRRFSYTDKTASLNTNSHTGNAYDDFLKTLQMVAEVFVLQNVSELRYGWELMQRDKKLNLSGSGLPWDELTQMVEKKQIVPVAVKCRDRYGDYGIIGFATIFIKSGNPLLNNAVFSRRVSQKKIEQHFFEGISAFFKDQGYRFMQIRLNDANNIFSQFFSGSPILNDEGTETYLTVRLDKLEHDREILKLKLADSLYDSFKTQSMPGQ